MNSAQRIDNIKFYSKNNKNVLIGLLKILLLIAFK